MVGQAAGGGVLHVQLSALGVHLGDGVDVLEDGGDDGISLVLGHVLVGDDGGLHAHGGDVLVDALIGAGGDDALGVGAGDLLQLGDVLLVQADQVAALGGGQVDHGGGGSAGDDERGVDLAVLQGLGGIAKAEVLGIDVGLGHVIGGEEVHGVEVHAGALGADGDVLALQVLDALDVGVAGDQLHGLGVQGAQGGEGIDGVALVLLEANAVVGVVRHVVLHEAQLGVADVQQVDVGGGAVARDGGDGHVGMVGDVLSQHAAEGVVGAGSTAGGEGQLRQGGDAAQRQNQRDDQGHNFLHGGFLHFRAGIAGRLMMVLYNKRPPKGNRELPT